MLKKLENKLHEQIPLTKYMQMKIEKIEENKLFTSAPIGPNINDKKTAFAGSLSTLVTISSWSACYLIVEEQLKYKDTMIAVIKSDTAYRAPVKKALYCKTLFPNQEEIERLKEKLETKGSGSLRIKSQIIEDNKVCVDFEGIYVIKI